MRRAGVSLDDGGAGAVRRVLLGVARMRRQ